MNLSTVKRPFDLRDYLKYSTTLIETGTCKGEGVQRALDAGFSLVRSVELHPDLFQHCKRRFNGNERVELWEGSSYEQLPKMITGVSVFFLDAHPAGPNTAGHKEWLEKDESVFQDTIIKKELEVILKTGKTHCIIIDDVQDTTYLEDYKRLILAVNPFYKFKVKDQKFHDTFYRDKILVCEP